ncbi:MAG: ATP-dependent helicase [Micrococcales bacterium]|nr:ATP-dependent helicase [Micrococcales bacterium]
MSTDVLDRFSPATQAWFRGSFSAPTDAQRGAWEAVSSGHHALVVAPTGSGKTLSAFLWAIDRLASEPPPAEALQRCRVLYVSPMKALAVDVERNLRSPLVGIGHAADRLGLPRPDITVAVRSGDTPAADRRAFARRPSDILITTPESLFLMLTSSVREALTGIETVIIDEVHAVAGTKRGAHLALSLERLDALLPTPAQRIGLSATVEPVDEVARYLAGGRPVEIVRPPSDKEWELDVVVPVADMSELGEPTGDLTGNAAGEERRASIWPHVEERIVELVAAHRSTLVFANSRRLAERLTSRLNEIWQDRQFEAMAAEFDSPPDSDSPASHDGHPSPATDPAAASTRHTPRPPAQVMAQSGASKGAPAVLARAHHGSVSKEHRQQIEEDLKAGRLPAVVATSSLELGIDMGAVDLVVQVESPPSVASGLQRVGRAGHQVGAVSKGVLFPKFRGDLVQTAVVVERMRAGAIESLTVPSNPVDVLAQQIVAMCAMDEWSVDDLEQLVRRAASFASLPRSVLEAVLDMLSGRYPSDEFAELRPRVTWDRVAGVLTGRRGAQRLAVTSGGTIPDRGLYAVYLASGEGPGRRVGELDEEMVYESRVGDVFTLGTSTWRIEDITHDRVLVTPAPGEPGRLPFWKGDQQGRPAELGRAVGAFVREVGSLPDAKARKRIGDAGLDEWAVDNLLAYLAEQREATGHLPDDRTIVIERFRDELGDWRVAVHSPYGGQVHAPWALCVSSRMQERFGVDVQAMHGDDGIIFRLPDVEFDDERALGAELLALVALDPDEVHDLVTAQMGGSALFAARFRECAARALLLPRRRPDRRQPLWQQRQRASQLLQVASQYASFPIVLEAVRECVQDVFDVPGLTELMRSIASREVTVVEVESRQPSPFARSLLFGYVAQFLYEGDSPLAERRAAALALDPSLLAELLGRGEAMSLRDLLDPAQVARTEAELQRLVPERACRDAEDVGDLLRVIGPLPVSEIVRRSTEGTDDETVTRWLHELAAARQVIEVSVAGETRWAAVDDAGRLRDALGVSLPVGVPQAFLEPVADPLGDLVARYARTHGPFTAHAVAQWWGVGPAVATDALRRLVSSGRLVEGELLPLDHGGGHGLEFCDAEVLRLLRRRSLAALRAEVEPVAATDYARFLPAWQECGGRLRGEDGVLRAVEQLSGSLLPASAIESLVLPARVRDYRPAMLDELMSAGEVLWRGHGSLPGDDGWVSLHLADTAAYTLGPIGELELGEQHRAVLDALDTGGAFFFRGLADAIGATDDTELAATLWDLVWSGRLGNDTLAPLRALQSGGRTAHKRAASAPRSRRYGRAGGGLGLGPARPGRPTLPARGGPPTTAGRWSLLPERESDPTALALAGAEVLLDRYGVLTRGSVVAEGVEGGFAGVYRVLSAAEEAGRVRRGYFVESLGASQFGTTGAVDRLRATGRPLDEWTTTEPEVLVLAACDPANPYGAALPWPDRPHDAADGDGAARPGKTAGGSSGEGSSGMAQNGAGETATATSRGHQPGRKAGALVVLVDGRLVLYVERGGRTLLSWSTDERDLTGAAQALATAVREGALGRLTVEKADGGALLGSDHPMAAALASAGFHTTPRGLRIRR